MVHEGPTRVHLSESVQIEVRAGGNRAVAIVEGDDLLGIVVEGVDVQRDAVEEKAEPGAHYGASVGERHPGDSGAGRHAKALRDYLRFGANADIGGESRGDAPMVLAEDGVLGVGHGERAASEKGDPLEGKTAGISHFGFRLKNAKDIDAAAEVILSAGGTIIDKGEFMTGEPYLFFEDPDGYPVEVWYELLPE